MATLAKREGKTPSYEIQFFQSGQRTTIYLGGRRYSEKTANELKDIVERLIYCRDNSQMLDKRTLVWLESATPEIRDKLAKAGLIDVPQSHTVKELWDSFLKQKDGVKESTIGQYEYAKQRFFDHFGADEILTDLTQARMRQWKESLKGSIAESTIAGTLTKAKAVFNWGIEAGWIDESPLTGIGRGSFVNKSRDRIIPMEDYYSLLDKCPCQDWRVIIALARIGGLRCPSEVLRLTWNDVLWDKTRFWVTSPKTEHHDGKEGRWVPLFPELREEMEKLFYEQPEGTEFVINRYRSDEQNLRTHFARIAKRAGLPGIPRPFDNMRMTRSNEVYNRWGAFKESEWIGHSARTRQDHYLMIQDTDFEAASSTREPATVKSRLEACFTDRKTPAVFPAERHGIGPQGVAKENCDTKEKGL